MTSTFRQPQMGSGPIQLDQWSNSKAPLSNQQRASVNRLADWLHRNSPEYKVAFGGAPPTAAPAGPIDASVGTAKASETQPSAAEHGQGEIGAALASQPSTSAVTLPDVRAPLSSAQDFLAWFTGLSASITSATQNSHQKALAEVAAATASATSLLSQLESCQINVSELRAGSAFVEDSSKGLREEAQALLESQLHLDNLSEEIASRLSFFTLLPYATALLSSPDSSVVNTQEFLDLLDQLEMALLFLQQEPARSYKDAALYRMRYAQCVTRGATLAKIAVCRGFKDLGDDVVQRVKDAEGRSSISSDKGKAKEAPDTNEVGRGSISAELSEALYGPQSALATKLRPLIHELERRAYPFTSPQPDADRQASNRLEPVSSNAPEFESLLEECRSSWFAARRPVVARLIGARIAEVEASAFATGASTGATEGLERLSSHGMSIVQWFVDRESKAYSEFFWARHSSHPQTISVTDLDADPPLKAYLQGLFDTLHNRLRPRILKEGRVSTLALACKVFVDVQGVADPSQPGAASSGIVSALSHALLHEIQLRLIFRAQAVVSGEIGGFLPKEDQGHLDFPEAIQAAKRATSSHLDATRPNHHRRGKSGAGLLEAAMVASTDSSVTSSTSSVKDGEGEVRLFTMSDASRAAYYPPLIALVDLLAQLQGQIAPKAFRELANDGVESCRKAVERGSELLVKRKKGGLQREDGWLFLIRQYEFLREVVVSVDLVLKSSSQPKQQQGKRVSVPTPTASSQEPALPTTSKSLVDLSSLAGAINSLWTSTGRLLYPATDLPGQPDEVATSTGHLNDALESQLRATISNLASLWSSMIVLPLSVFLDSSRTQISGAIVAEKVAGTLDALQTCIESVGGEKAAKLSLWVEDDEVRKGVVESVVRRVGERHAEVLEVLRRGGGYEGEVKGRDEVEEEVRRVLAGGGEES